MIIAIVGQTASGKTGASLELAQHIDCEIVSADAYQMYIGMDIGTAKPTRAERGHVIHHQIDVLTIDEPASVAQYQTDARTSISGIYARDRVPVVVGGSGLYLRALLDDIDFPGTDTQVRARLSAEAEQLGTAAMYQRLCELDPQAGAAIEANNIRRIVRALEVIEITGAPFSANLPTPSYYQPCAQFAIGWEIDELEQRIRRRSEEMVADGLVGEVMELMVYGLEDSPTARRATGYAQVIDYLDGRYTRAQLIDAITLATRQVAVKQRKWFKRDERITWVSPTDAAAGKITDLALAALAGAAASSEPSSTGPDPV